MQDTKRRTRPNFFVSIFILVILAFGSVAIGVVMLRASDPRYGASAGAVFIAAAILLATAALIGSLEFMVTAIYETAERSVAKNSD